MNKMMKTKRPEFIPPKESVYKSDLNTLTRDELLTLYNQVRVRLNEMDSDNTDEHCNFDWTR